MSQDKNTKRLADLESALAYLQKDYDALNETVLENTQRLEQLKNTVDRLTTQLQGLANASSEPRRIEDEKPPHY